MHFTGARLEFICCFQATFVQKYFPPLSNENVKQYQKMVMYKLCLCFCNADVMLLYVSSFDSQCFDTVGWVI